MTAATGAITKLIFTLFQFLQQLIKNSRFALRLEIINKNMDTVLNDYQSRLKKGELTSSSTEFNGISATRIDGTFEKELRGSVVLMKVRDKTIRFSTDADTFKPDFQTI